MTTAQLAYILVVVNQVVLRATLERGAIVAQLRASDAHLVPSRIKPVQPLPLLAWIAVMVHTLAKVLHNV